MLQKYIIYLDEGKLGLSVVFRPMEYQFDQLIHGNHTAKGQVIQWKAGCVWSALHWPFTGLECGRMRIIHNLHKFACKKTYTHIAVGTPIDIELHVFSLFCCQVFQRFHLSTPHQTCDNTCGTSCCMLTTAKILLYLIIIKHSCSTPLLLPISLFNPSLVVS